MHMVDKYVPQEIEKKWQKKWLEDKALPRNRIRTRRNIMFWKCSHIHPGIFTWGM